MGLSSDPFLTPDPKRLPLGKFNDRHLRQQASGNWDNRRVLRDSLGYLAMFQERVAKDANGRRIMVLAKDLGKGPVAESDHPFQLSVALVGENYEWQVSSVGSTVTDGTNGSNIDLSGAGFDSGTVISATKLIILWATIDGGTLVASDWELAAVDAADADEVKIEGSPAEQTEVRLLIGKIVFADGVPTAYQCIREAQLLTHGLVNGLAVRCFSPHPVHKDHF